MHTRKLHSTPRSSAVRNGRPALAAAVATTDSYTPSKVPAATVRAATDPAPSTLARYTTPQLRSIRPHVSCRSSSGITSRQLPVNSSLPASSTIASPAGNTAAPASLPP